MLGRGVSSGKRDPQLAGDAGHEREASLASGHEVRHDQATQVDDGKHILEFVQIFLVEYWLVLCDISEVKVPYNLPDNNISHEDMLKTLQDRLGT